MKKGNKKHSLSNSKEFDFGFFSYSRKGCFIFIVLFLALVSYGLFLNSQVYRLRKKGICTEAVVFHRKYGFRNVRTNYRFIWNGKTYEGVSTDNLDVKYQSKSIFKSETIFMVGDTIAIVFLEANPNINRSNRVVEKECN